MNQPERSVQPDIEASAVAHALPPVTPARRTGDETPGRAVLPAWLRTLLFTLAGLFIFILALQLLKQGAGTYGRDIIRFLNVSNTANSLGFGWLLAYIFLSGSPVAAIAVS